MGVVATITHDYWPKQGPWLHKPVIVLFHYDRTHPCRGVIVRDDVEEPWRTMIQLEDGRVVLATECQYSLEKVDRNV